ncbi:uncharacterized protein BYT42DRAFT_576762 [Radiomyces spectabilis]|uniref:uncharacterized protein n=1 Tax=Radiomyces spectabilis TaxID=64574 RepID=UPI00222093CF|nr:uncharacterized protein BYT42DRAFT_576762 [Radiomyces spectabilis]KAI8374564.1 hypothetical protein BYT42DRAFT_576762 [Radiomyces spectabilis]
MRRILQITFDFMHRHSLIFNVLPLSFTCFIISMITFEKGAPFLDFQLPMQHDNAWLHNIIYNHGHGFHVILFALYRILIDIDLLCLHTY